VTRASIDNAIAAIAGTGGSTNGVLHLLAIAHEYGLALDIDDFGTIADRTPIVADLQPGGRYTATHLYEAGGLALVMRELLAGGRIDGATPNVDGRTIAEIADAARATEGQDVVVPIERPLKPTGGLAILRGSLAPDGCVVKLAATSAVSTAARPACSSPKGTATRPSATAGSSPAMSSSSATRVRLAVRACRRC